MADTTSQKRQPGEALAELPLPELLGGIIDGLLRAQDQLDRHAAQRATEYVETPGGTLALPPLWHTLHDVRIDLEMSASITSGMVRDGKADPVLLCRLTNPASVSMFGYQASAALRISMQVGVNGAIPLKTATS